jgi:hypothetical protein
MVEELTPTNKRHHKEELFGRLKCVVDLDEERVVHTSQDLSLSFRVLDLVFIDQVLLIERFDGIDHFSILVLAKHHLSERSPSQHFDDLKILNSNLSRMTLFIAHWLLVNHFHNGFFFIVILSFRNVRLL